MKKTFSILISFILLNIAARSANTEPPPQILLPLDYLIDDQHSYIGFKIKYFGFSPVRGRFNEFKGHILYDEKDISKTSVTVFIDVHSINTGVEMRDNDLKSKHWFDVEKYPYIKFQSKKIEATTAGFDLIGDLSIKEVTKEVVLSFEAPTKISKDFAGNNQVDFSGRLKIRRSDFGVMGNGFWNSLMDGTLQQLADEVSIEIDAHCRRPDYAIRKKDLEDGNIRKMLLEEFDEKGKAKGLELLAHYKETGTKEAKTYISSGVLSTLAYILLQDGKKPRSPSRFSKESHLVSRFQNGRGRSGKGLCCYRGQRKYD